MYIEDFFEKISRMNLVSGRGRKKVVIGLHSPGSIGGTGVAEINSVEDGFDWNSGKIIIHTKQKLTALSSDEVEAMAQFARLNQSQAVGAKAMEWSSEKRILQERIKELERKIGYFQQLLQSHGIDD